jgi:hypothetical protein
MEGSGFPISPHDSFITLPMIMSSKWLSWSSCCAAPTENAAKFVYNLFVYNIFVNEASAVWEWVDYSMVNGANSRASDVGFMRGLAG